MSEIVAQLRTTEGTLSDSDKVLTEAANEQGIDVNLLLAFGDVESKLQPYDSRGRLHLLPEKHKFWKYLPAGLRKRAERMGLAHKDWRRSKQYKGLGRPGSDKRWDRLADMAAIDETAALKSPSAGKWQILGANHQICGYPSPQDFWLAMAASEDAQDKAFVAFCQARGVFRELRENDIEGAVRIYNGTGQVASYSAQIRDKYQKRSKGKSIEIKDPVRANGLRIGSEGYRVRSLQERLLELGYQVQVDGDFGPATYRAVVAFQAEHGLKPDGIVGEKTQAGLEAASPIDNSEREKSTVEDVVERSRIAKRGTILQRVGRWVGIGGGAAVGVEQTDTFDWIGGLMDKSYQVQSLLESFSGFIQFAQGLWWIIIPAAGVALWYYGREIVDARVDDHRAGKTI